eukprot:tig00000269_g23717.t1
MPVPKPVLNATALNSTSVSITVFWPTGSFINKIEVSCTGFGGPYAASAFVDDANAAGVAFVINVARAAGPYELSCTGRALGLANVFSPLSDAVAVVIAAVVPEPPVLAMVSATRSKIVLNISEPACAFATSCSLDGATHVELYRTPAWTAAASGEQASKPILSAGVLEGFFEDSDVLAGTNYTYRAMYVSSDGNKSADSNYLWVVSSANAPTLSGSGADSTSTTVKITIKTTSDASLANSTNLFRNATAAIQWDGTLLATRVWTNGGLSPGMAYEFYATLTMPVMSGPVGVESEPSNKHIAWTAVNAPVPVVANKSASPSVTISVPLPMDYMAKVVTATRCKREDLAGGYVAIQGRQIVEGSPQVAYAGQYTFTCVFDGMGGTMSASGSVSVTLPPRAPSVVLLVTSSNEIRVDIQILDDTASANLATGFILYCNDTNAARILQKPLQTATLDNLRPSTVYTCFAEATSPAGSSANSTSKSATTDDLPKPTLTTTGVNVTAVWIMMEVPELAAEVVVSGVRIFRSPNNVSDWAEVTTLPMINSGATPQTRTFVDVGRNPQTYYYYKAVYLTPVPSKESDSKLARTGPPAPRISVTEENVRAFSVTISFDNGPPLNTTLITRTFVSRNSTADNVDCGTNKNAAVGSCADTAAAIQPGTAYVYVAQYEGKVFYGGSERWENGPESGPLTVTSDLVTASIPVLSVQQITATTARVCVTYPTDGSEVEILTTEFTRLWLPSLETAPETYSMPRYPAVSVQCRAWTSLEPGTTSNFTAYYTTSATASLMSSVLQVMQLRPAAPVLSVHPDTDAPTATSVQIRVAFPSPPAAVPSTDPQEDLAPKVNRIDLYRDGEFKESKIADLSSINYVFTDAGLPPGLTFSYQAALFTAYTQSGNGSVSVTTAVAEAPTVTASGIDATSVKVTVTRPVPEQAAAVAIRIYNATVTAGVVSSYTSLVNISKSSPTTETTYEYTHSGLEAGAQYLYKADYTTAGNPNSRAGLDSKISLSDSAWTSPNPPVLSLSSSTTSTMGVSTNVIRIVPSTADSDISKLVLERVSGGYSCTVTSSWLGGAAGNADCTDSTALPGTMHTYIAYYVGQENMKSTNASITVTTPPEAPAVNGLEAVDFTVFGYGPQPWGNVVPWHLDRLDQASGPLDGRFDRGTVDGSGVDIYVVDTGVLATHPELQGRVVPLHDIDSALFAPGSELLGSDCSPESHGTATAAAAAGRTLGVAPGATVLSVKVARSGGAAGNCSARARHEDVLAGLEHVLASVQNRGRPSVTLLAISSTWSNADSSLPKAEVVALYKDVVARLREAESVVITAAGNDYADACSNMPGNTPGAINVGASDQDDYRAGFSNYGSCVTLFAPGQNVRSAMRPKAVTGANGRPGFNATTGIFHGTSYAAGVTAGVAALYLQALPESPLSVIEDTMVSGSVAAMRASILNGSPNRLLSVSKVLLPGATSAVGPAAYDASLFSGVEIGMCSFTPSTTAGLPSALHRQLLQWGDAYFDVASEPAKASGVFLARLRLEQDYNGFEITLRNLELTYPSLAIYVGNPTMPSYERRLYGWFRTEDVWPLPNPIVERHGASIRPGTYYILVQGNVEYGNVAGPGLTSYRRGGFGNATGAFRLDVFDTVACPYHDYAPDHWTDDGTCEFVPLGTCSQDLVVARARSVQNLQWLVQKAGIWTDYLQIQLPQISDHVMRFELPFSLNSGEVRLDNNGNRFLPRRAECVSPFERGSSGDLYGGSAHSGHWCVWMSEAMVVTDGCPADPTSNIVAKKDWMYSYSWGNSAYSVDNGLRISTNTKVLLSGTYYIAYFPQNKGSQTWATWVNENGLTHVDFPR